METLLKQNYSGFNTYNGGLHQWKQIVHLKINLWLHNKLIRE